MSYKTQGFIKEINLNNGAFTMDPTSPYAFEMRTSTGVSAKHVLFVQGDAGASSVKAVVVPEGSLFDAEEPMGCVATLINLRHAHDKLEVEVEDETVKSLLGKANPAGGGSPAKVESIKIVK